MEKVDEIKRELETLITRLLALSVDTVENLFNILIEFFRKASPVPMVIPQIVVPDELKRKSVEEVARLLARLLTAPLKPEQVTTIVEEVLKFAETVKQRYESMLKR